jgi:hypothetical protein
MVRSAPSVALGDVLLIDDLRVFRQQVSASVVRVAAREHLDVAPVLYAAATGTRTHD